MVERNNSYLLNGGEDMGMTDNQYKGMLLDFKRDLKRILSLVKAAGNTEATEEVEEQLANIDEKLQF